MFPFNSAKQSLYERYLRAHETGDHSEIDHEQLLGDVQQFARHAPPEVQQQVFAQYFQQLPLEQRQQLMQQMGQSFQGAVDPSNPQQLGQHPGLLQKLLAMASSHSGGVPGQSSGAGGLLSNPMAKSALVGLAGLAARHLMGGGHASGMGGGLFGGQQGYGSQQEIGGGWEGEREGRYAEDTDRDRDQSTTDEVDGGRVDFEDRGESGGGDSRDDS